MLRDRLLGSVFTKTIRDWLLWTVIAIVALWAVALMYVWIMTIAGDEYMTLMDDMPEAFTNIYGQHDGTPAGLAMSGVFSVMGPLILLAYAIGLGSSAAVGEEEARTLPILLSNPLRRRTILLTKTGVAAIGGITPHNGAQLVAAGADMLAVVQGVFAAADIGQAARAYAALFDRDDDEHREHG